MCVQASLEAMRLAVEDLSESPEYVFVDGNRLPQPLKMPAEFVIKGDSKVFSIAAASVIAKVGFPGCTLQRMCTRLSVLRGLSKVSYFRFLMAL